MTGLRPGYCDGIAQAVPLMLMKHGRMIHHHAALTRESSDMLSTTHRDDVVSDAHLVII